MEKFYHLYHAVNISSLPLMVGFSILSVMMSMIKVFSFCENDMCMLSLIMKMIVFMFGWLDVIRESTYQGYHSGVVLNGLMVGMILFIVSEGLFLFSLF